MNNYFNVLSKVFAITGGVVLALSAAGHALRANEIGGISLFQSCGVKPGTDDPSTGDPGYCWGGPTPCPPGIRCQHYKPPQPAVPPDFPCCYNLPDDPPLDP
jgi:hypothetical protein